MRFRLPITYLASLLLPLCATATPEIGSVTLNGKPSTAVFFGGASADGGTTFRHGFSASETVSVTVDLAPAAEDVGKQGAILVLGSLDGIFYQKQADGSWRVWDGDVVSLGAAIGPKTLQSQETIDALTLPSGLFSGKNVQVIVGYLNSSETLHYTWPPVEFSIAGRCTLATGTGSIQITAENGPLIAELAYRTLDALNDASSLIDQNARAAAVSHTGSIACTDGGGIAAQLGNQRQAGVLDSGESVLLDFQHCRLGDNVEVNNTASLSLTSTTGTVNNAFNSDWSYRATNTFGNFKFAQNMTTIKLDGQGVLFSQLFSATGIQLIDVTSPLMDFHYNEIPLRAEEICDESNAFGAGKKHSQSSSFELNSASAGNIVATTPIPMSGTFGGPPNEGVMEIRGGKGSSMRLDAAACGDNGFDLQIYPSANAAATPQPNCIDFSALKD